MNDLLIIMLKQCKEKVEAFVNCSKAEGLMVVFRCRGHNNAMNACLGRFNTPENWEKVKDGDMTTLRPRDGAPPPIP